MIELQIGDSSTKKKKSRCAHFSWKEKNPTPLQRGRKGRAGFLAHTGLKKGEKRELSHR